VVAETTFFFLRLHKSCHDALWGGQSINRSKVFTTREKVVKIWT